MLLSRHTSGTSHIAAGGRGDCVAIAPRDGKLSFLCRH
jgi:hypothetical protein